VSSLIIIIAMFGLLWVLLIRPQRAKQQQQQKMLSAVEPGDEILTVGGLYGIVQELDEDDDLIVEIAEGIHVRVARRAVATVVKPDDDDVDEDADEEALDGEADLHDGEEAVDEGEAEVKSEVESVNSEPAAPAAADERS
jgi:preprotein translocase subunit YajC